MNLRRYQKQAVGIVSRCIIDIYMWKKQQISLMYSHLAVYHITDGHPLPYPRCPQCFISQKGHIVFLTEQQHKKNISGNKKIYKNAIGLGHSCFCPTNHPAVKSPNDKLRYRFYISISGAYRSRKRKEDTIK